MRNTAIVYTQRFLSHNPGYFHPESPLRLYSIMKGIEELGVLKRKNCLLLDSEPASIETLESVHSLRYINYVRQISEAGGGTIDEETETVLSRESFDVARLAAGGVLRAINKVMSQDFQNSFVLSRPPGHHAGSNYGLGFCIFNNVAIGAKYLLDDFGLRKILILDIDSHHGNGTQQIFYKTKKVLYISLHEDPTNFPQTGFYNETGHGEGLGYTVNVPFPYGTGDSVYWGAIKTIVAPIVNQFEPQFILMSAGFDGHYRDNIGELSLSSQIYSFIFRTVIDWANNICEGRFVAVLEGGYCQKVLRKIVPSIISEMASHKTNLHDKPPILDLETQKRAEKILKMVKRIQSKFWKFS
ncbi:MAG: histone deacetylase [Candidatus Bathyarchaeia archaeon]